MNNAGSLGTGILAALAIGLAAGMATHDFAVGVAAGVGTFALLFSINITLETIGEMLAKKLANEEG